MTSPQLPKTVDKSAPRLRKLQNDLNELKVAHSRLETEVKYIRILLVVMLGANAFIGVKYGIPAL